MANNYVQLTGNMTKPEMRTTKTGKKIANFSMVVKTGGDADDMWINVQAWEKLAENIEQSFPATAKSMRVMVEGSLKKDSWVDQATGENKSRFLINANNVCATLDYQSVSGVKYSGDGNVQTQQTQQVAQTQPVARPMDEIPQGDAPF